MFGRLAPKPTNKTLDDLIVKATDATLTSDHWEYIMEVCDKISLDPENSIQLSVVSIGQRLAQRDANVNLRALLLLVAMAENCGLRMRLEIATKQFLDELLVKKMGDRKVHPTVKHRIAEVVEQLKRSFTDEPRLKPILDAYDKIQKSDSQFLAAPLKPLKQEISKTDKAHEEEELKRALNLSLAEYQRTETLKNISQNQQAQNQQSMQVPQSQNPQNSQSQAMEALNERPATPEATIATISKVRALYDLISYEPDELSFRKGDVITVIESVYRDWWRGLLPSGKTGIFPLNYVTPVVTKLGPEIAREVATENQLLAQLRKADQLLAMLLNPENVKEEDITRLYNDLMPLRPPLGQFIEKYLARKEELLQLRGQTDNELKEYNQLMDAQIMRALQTGANQVTTPYPFGSFLGDQQSQLALQPTASGFGNATENRNRNQIQNQNTGYQKIGPFAQQGYHPYQEKQQQQQQAYQRQHDFHQLQHPYSQQQEYKQEQYHQTQATGQGQAQGKAHGQTQGRSQDTNIPTSYIGQQHSGYPFNEVGNEYPPAQPLHTGGRENRHLQNLQRASSQQFLNISQFPDVNAIR